MSDETPTWVPATRESAGHYADEVEVKPRDLRTCTQRQDAAIEGLRIRLDEHMDWHISDFGKVIADLTARVAALEAAAQKHVIDAKDLGY